MRPGMRPSLMFTVPVHNVPESSGHGSTVFKSVRGTSYEACEACVGTPYFVRLTRTRLRVGVRLTKLRVYV